MERKKNLEEEDTDLLYEKVLNNKFLKSKRLDKTKILSNNKNEKCEICEKPSKYKCPCCLTKTCSLQCVQQHKAVYKCLGKRPEYNKTIENTDELMKDIKYLSSMINKTNTVRKQIHNSTFENNNYIDSTNLALKTDNEICTSKKKQNVNKNNETFNPVTTDKIEHSINHHKKNNLTEFEINTFKDKRLKGMIKLCRRYRQVTYEKCPMNLSRFHENKTYCDSKQKKFFWTVKFYFLDLATNESKEKPNSPLTIPSHLFPLPFDDSIYSLDNIVRYLIENKHEIVDSRILELLSVLEGKFVKTEESSYSWYDELAKRIIFYKRISKIDYQNTLLFNNSNKNNNYASGNNSKMNTNLNGKSNILEQKKILEVQPNYILKLNDYYYFKILENERVFCKISESIKNTTVKDYLEFYIKIKI